MLEIYAFSGAMKTTLGFVLRGEHNVGCKHQQARKYHTGYVFVVVAVSRPSHVSHTAEASGSDNVQTNPADYTVW